MRNTKETKGLRGKNRTCISQTVWHRHVLLDSSGWQGTARECDWVGHASRLKAGLKSGPEELSGQAVRGGRHRLGEKGQGLGSVIALG